jgi:hypothetical protein
LIAARLLPLGTLTGALVWCFWDVLFFDNNFAFRDAAHFYYPLFEHIQAEWAAGRIPLWNPYENSGEPLLANSTSSVFYPGKLIFLLPLDYAWNYKLYILSHVVLSAATAYILPRRWCVSRPAATLGAMSYAFSGHILYQYTNPVFLCAAAWLPLAVWFADRMLVTRRWRYAALLGVLLSLMVLSGDPQLAYETGALAALGAVLYWRADLRERIAHTGKRSEPSASRRPLRPALLALAAVSMVGLSAVQLLPTSELSGLSDRAYFDLPRNVYEIPVWLKRDYPPPQHLDGSHVRWYDGLLGKHPEPVSHLRALHNFSVAPWRLVEYVWPNVSGLPLPGNRRWLHAFNDEESTWVPSLYMGLLPLILAVGTWRLRSPDPRIRWLSWMVLLGIVAAFGKYGIGWLWNQLSGSDRVGPEVGGLYWLMTVTLPGFVQFRYPGKLLTVTALGLSMLAAFGFERWHGASSLRFRRLLSAAAIASLGGLVAWIAVGPFWQGWVAGTGNDFFGPLDVDGAYRNIGVSLLQTLLLSILLIVLLYWMPSFMPMASHDAARAHPVSRRPSIAIAIVLLTAADICIANGRLVVSAASHYWTAPSRTAELLSAAEQQSDSASMQADLPRVYRADMAAPHFRHTPSTDRAREALEWDRNTLKPKYAMMDGFSLARVDGTIHLFDYQLFLMQRIREEPLGFVQPRRCYDALGIKYFVLPKVPDGEQSRKWLNALRYRWNSGPPDATMRAPLAPDGERLSPPVAEPARWLDSLDDQIEVLANDSAYPRTWIVHDIYITRRIETADRRSLLPMLDTMIWPGEHVIDMRHAAWVEDDDLDRQVPQGRLQTPPADPAAESCRITDYRPDRVEIEATLTSPGLVVLSDAYYPGWELTVTTPEGVRPLAVARTNRVMRGALLPAGRFKLVYQYRPTSFYFGAVITLATLSLGVLSLGMLYLRRASAR